MNILAFGASNNSESINRILACYAAGLVVGSRVETLDIDDYEMPIFSDQREQALGQPPQARGFIQKIAQADALVVSFAEHNGSYTAAYKNLFDWASRTQSKVFQNKPTIYLSTSPGSAGGASVLAAAVDSARYAGARLLGSLSVPCFHRHFDMQTGTLSDTGLRRDLEQVMQLLRSAL